MSRDLASLTKDTTTLQTMQKLGRQVWQMIHQQGAEPQWPQSVDTSDEPLLARLKTLWSVRRGRRLRFHDMKRKQAASADKDPKVLLKLDPTSLLSRQMRTVTSKRMRLKLNLAESARRESVAAAQKQASAEQLKVVRGRLRNAFLDHLAKADYEWLKAQVARALEKPTSQARQAMPVANGTLQQALNQFERLARDRHFITEALRSMDQPAPTPSRKPRWRTSTVDTYMDKLAAEESATRRQSLEQKLSAVDSHARRIVNALVPHD